eukprot:3658027-Amphidinium_carterae.1
MALHGGAQQQKRFAADASDASCRCAALREMAERSHGKGSEETCMATAGVGKLAEECLVGTDLLRSVPVRMHRVWRDWRYRSCLAKCDSKLIGCL